MNREFIPTRAPHFGDLWETTVKSFKHHLIRIVNNTLLPFVQLETLIEIEVILNSRPISLIFRSQQFSSLNPRSFPDWWSLNELSAAKRQQYLVPIILSTAITTAAASTFLEEMACRLPTPINNPNRMEDSIQSTRPNQNISNIKGGQWFT